MCMKNERETHLDPRKVYNDRGVRYENVNKKVEAMTLYR